jgi:hypothetical protein
MLAVSNVRTLRLMACAGLLIVGVGNATAAGLTCDQFRDRLNGALMLSGDKDVEGLDFAASAAQSGRGQRLSWTTSGLDGTVECDASNAFSEFFVNAQFRSKEEFSAQLKRLTTVSGASICALASDGFSACAEFSRGMLRTVLEQIGSAYNHGAKNPSGIVSRPVVPGAKAELTAAATLVTFLIDRDGTLDEARQTLLPAPPPSTDPQP